MTKIRVISDNDLHVIYRCFLEAASEMHIAMCRFPNEHSAQVYLNRAMNSILDGASECNKLHNSPMQKIVSNAKEPDGESE